MPDEAKIARKNRSEEELKAIAVGIADGNIFCSMQIPPGEQQHMLHSVFMVLAFMSKEDLERLLAENVSVFFEDMSKAGPMSVNGYPCFFSCQTLTKTEWELVVPMIKKYDEMKKEFLKS